jgi:hypothetical protein
MNLKPASTMLQEIPMSGNYFSRRSPVKASF